MTQPTSEAEVRKLLERRLGHAADEGIWEYLAQERWPSLVIEDEEPLEELARQYRRLEQLQRGAVRGAPREPRHVEPDERLRALGRKLAQEAAEEPAVIAFRAEVLRGRLLASEDVAAWIKRQEKADGKSTTYLGDVAVPPGHTVKSEREGLWVTPPLTLSKQTPAREAGAKLLIYAIPNQSAVFRLPVADGGILDRLRSLSETLANSYGWPGDTGRAQAALFVLTGRAPTIPRATITWHIDLGVPALGRITLDLDPTLGPAAVAKLYREARAQFPLGRRSRRYRAMTKKHARLAEWADKEGSWRERMEEWNRTCPKDERYKDSRNFARDVTHAARRLYGE